MDFAQTACLGGGVIGASWVALFLASGRSVSVFDPGEGAEDAVRRYVEQAWLTLEDLGMTEAGTPDALRFCRTAAEAVEGAAFVQESIPERMPLKHALYSEIEPVLRSDAIVASSASGLMLGQLQEGWKDPSRLVLGHPFNPPHLIPLVEVMGNDKTAEGVLERTEAFYKAVGKVTIRLNKEMPGHVSNRLQAAIWREAIHLVMEGVVSVEDADKAIWAGPGLRWAAMGPTMLFHLAAGKGGLESFFEHFTDMFNGWWENMGDVRLDPEVCAKIAAGVRDAAGEKSPAELSKERDAMITAMIKATQNMG